MQGGCVLLLELGKLPQLYLYIQGRYILRLQVDKCLNCRVGGGFWRRGGETPSAVKWEDRIIEIREGSWSYVAGSIGRAPGMFYINVT
jgi:hypothetical protein